MTGGQQSIDPITDALFMDIHVKFTLAFPSNVGKLELLQLNLFLDGYRPTVIATLDTAATGSTVETAVFANGIYIFMYIYLYMFIYIYVLYIFIHIHVFYYIHICIYLFIYIYRLCWRDR
jgi:hypothetical protein